MPPKKKITRTQTQKQKQRQSVVVNVNTAPKRSKAKRKGRRSAAPRLTVEDAEYINALNRTIPAVQINPMPLMQEDRAIGLVRELVGQLKPQIYASPYQAIPRINSVVEESRDVGNFSYKAPAAFPSEKNVADSIYSSSPIPILEGKTGLEKINITQEPAKVSIKALDSPPTEFFGVDIAQKNEFEPPQPPAAAGLPINRPDGDFSFSTPETPMFEKQDDALFNPKAFTHSATHQKNKNVLNDFEEETYSRIELSAKKPPKTTNINNIPLETHTPIIENKIPSSSMFKSSIQTPPETYSNITKSQHSQPSAKAFNALINKPIASRANAIIDEKPNDFITGEAAPSSKKTIGTLRVNIDEEEPEPIINLKSTSKVRKTKMPVYKKIADIFGLEESHAKERYNAAVQEQIQKGKTKKQAQDIVNATMRRAALKPEEARAKFESRPRSRLRMINPATQKVEIVNVKSNV